MASIGTGWVDGAWIEAAWVANPGAWDSTDVALLTGTVITATPTETDLVTGGQTIIITLIGREFKAAAGGPIGTEANSLALLSGMNSAQSESTGWNAEIRDKEVTTAITRDSATQATIVLTASPDYDITANETITVIVPADVLTEGLAIVATPDFDVTFVSDVVARRGGGRGADRRKPRRKVVLGGRVYVVSSLAEEQQLLANYISERTEEVPELAPAAKRAARISIRKATKRLAAVEDRMAKQKKANQKVLLLFAAGGG